MAQPLPAAPAGATGQTGQTGLQGTTGQLPTPWSTFLHVGTTPRSKRCMRLRDNITSPTAALLCRSHRADGTDRPPGHHRLTSYFFLHLASPTAEVTLSEGNRA